MFEFFCWTCFGCFSFFADKCAMLDSRFWKLPDILRHPKHLVFVGDDFLRILPWGKSPINTNIWENIFGTFFQPPNYRKSKLRVADVLQNLWLFSNHLPAKIATFLLHVGYVPKKHVSQKLKSTAWAGGSLLYCFLGSWCSDGSRGKNAQNLIPWYGWFTYKTG